MKKKKYVQPTIDFIKLKVEGPSLLAVSSPDIEKEVDNDGAKWGEGEDDI